MSSISAERCRCGLRVEISTKSRAVTRRLWCVKPRDMVAVCCSLRDLSQGLEPFWREDKSSTVNWPFRENRPGSSTDMPADSLELRNSGREGSLATLFWYSLAVA